MICKNKALSECASNWHRTAGSDGTNRTDDIGNEAADFRLIVPADAGREGAARRTRGACAPQKQKYPAGQKKRLLDFNEAQGFGAVCDTAKLRRIKPNQTKSNLWRWKSVLKMDKSMAEAGCGRRGGKAGSRPVGRDQGEIMIRIKIRNGRRPVQTWSKPVKPFDAGLTLNHTILTGMLKLRP